MIHFLAIEISICLICLILYYLLYRVSSDYDELKSHSFIFTIKDETLAEFKAQKKAKKKTSTTHKPAKTQGILYYDRRIKNVSKFDK